MELEDETEGPVPELAQVILVQREDVLAGHDHAAALRTVQAAEDVQQRRLPHPGSPHDGDHLARRDVEVHPGQHRHVAGRGAVALDDVVGGDEGVDGGHPRNGFTTRTVPYMRSCSKSSDRSSRRP